VDGAGDEGPEEGEAGDGAELISEATEPVELTVVNDD